MAGFGVPEDQIARNVGADGIDAKTLRKHFPDELAIGATRANFNVASSLYQMAISKQHPAATMFWLKCRAGWRERPATETGPILVRMPAKNKSRAKLKHDEFDPNAPETGAVIELRNECLDRSDGQEGTEVLPKAA